jgi:hypothetical protein
MFTISQLGGCIRVLARLVPGSLLPMHSVYGRSENATAVSVCAVHLGQV